MAFQGKYHLRSKVILDGNTIEQVPTFNYPGYNVSFFNDIDQEPKLYKFQHICGTIKRILKNKVRRDTMLSL